MWLDNARRDIRDAIRTLSRTPRLAFATILTLAIGIGITTAVFAVLDAVVLQPLPYPHSADLVVAWQQDRTDKSPFTVSAANYLDWQRQSTVFEALAAVQEFAEIESNLTTTGAPESIKSLHCSPELFAVLGVAPAIGRVFTSADVQQHGDAIVLLGHDLWTSRFAGDADIVGRTIRVNGKGVTVLGVMPARFEVPLVSAQLYFPLAWTPAQRQERRISPYLVLGRLKHDVTLATATRELE